MSTLFTASAAFKPFAYPIAVELTKRHEKIHWVEEEADLGDDVTDWKLGTVTPAEKNFIIQILRLFTQSDVLVGGFYYDHLIPRFQNNEVRVMLGSFANREGVHQRAYSLLNETLGLPDSDYHAFAAYTEMAEKAEHMVDADATTDTGLLLALAKGVNNEGISLFASFAMLLNFQRVGKMKGMGKIVEWSQRDESVHVEGLAWLFRTLAAEHPRLVTDALKLAIYDMIRRTVVLEDAFVDLAFEMGGIPDLTAEQVKQYVRYVADRRLTQLGLKENWGIDANPLPWVDWLVSGADHTNFFEGRVTEYEKGGLIGDWSYANLKLGEVTVYTKPDCPWCEKLADLIVLCAKAGLMDPATRHVMHTPEGRGLFYDLHGMKGTAGPLGRTMPKVFIRSGDGKPTLIGGYTEFCRHIATVFPWLRLA